MNKQNFQLIDFFEKLLIPDLEKMIGCQLHYYAFSVICQAIEVMGSVYDQDELGDYGASKSRFNNGIDQLFRDKRYHEKRDVFYSLMRGPLVHQLRPGVGLFIASEKKDNILRKNHLEKDQNTGALIVVVEQFFSDFVDAFEGLKSEFRKRTDLDNRKINQTFISVFPIAPVYPMEVWDKDSKTLSTLTSFITGGADLR